MIYLSYALDDEQYVEQLDRELGEFGIEVWSPAREIFPGDNWAQAIGELIPVTHFLRIVRGLMLKGATPAQMSEELAALALTLVIVVALAISRYKVTLD